MPGPILPAMPRRRQSAARLAALLLLPLQGAPYRYTAPSLDCGAYLETVTNEVRSQSGAAVRQEHSGREGLFFLRAAAGANGIALEGWYDTLTVWREGPEGRVVPDASGLFGGRYRGILDPAGIYRGEAVPFVPDEVLEISDLAGVLADFFPRAPDRPLKPGERFTWTRHLSADTTAVQQDTLPVPVVRQTDEEGWLLWDPARGPVEWERRLTLTLQIDAKGAVKRGVRSTVQQRIRVVRRPGAPACAG